MGGRSDIRSSHDLHADDARYHIICRMRFTGKKIVMAAKATYKESTNEDYACKKVSKLFISEPTRLWTSVDLHQEYL